jgi:hypothetical protein
MNDHTINWESVVAVMAVLELLRALVIYFLVAPLRAAGSKIAHLEREVSEAKLGDLRQKLEESRQKIDELEATHEECQIKTFPQFVTRVDIEKSEGRRDHQLGAINDKLDTGLRNDSQQSTQLKNIEKQIATLFDLWNREHTKP